MVARASVVLFAFAVLAGCSSADPDATADGGAGDAAPGEDVAPPRPPGPIVKLKLTSPVGAKDAPFTVGQAFKPGDVPNGLFLTADVPAFQADVKNRWSDGSVKFAVLSGLAPLEANVPLAIQIASTTTAPATKAPTLEDLKRVLKAGTIAFSGGVSATIDLPTVVATAPFRDRYDVGPAMTEWHWRVPVGADPTLEAWIFVRLYANDALEIELCVENGRLLVPGPTTKSYAVTVSYGGATKYTGTLVHPYQSRWSRVDWYGADPAVIPAHDRAYLIGTKLVPNYAFPGTTSAALDALTQTYTPFSLPSLPKAMGTAGGASYIGLLPMGDAMYFASDADPRAWKAVMAMARGIGTYQVHFRDETTHLAPSIAAHPNLCINASGNNLGANPASTTDAYTPKGSGAQAPGTWDAPHHPAPGYLAALLSGRRVFVDELQLVTTAQCLAISDQDRDGGSCVFRSTSAGTVRGAAWSLRTLAMAITLTPDDEPLRKELQAQWKANMDDYVARYVDGTAGGGKYKNALGAVLSYQTNGPNSSEYEPGKGHLFMAPWMQAFLGASIGFAWDMEPTTDAAVKAKHRAFRDFLYRHAVGMVGDDGGFNYRRGASYALPYTKTESSSPVVWYASWAEVKAAHEAYYGLAPISGTGTLKQHDSDTDLNGSDSSSWPSGYWGNMTPALSYAVDHGAPGAAAGFARVRASPSFAFTAACKDDPTWGILPR
jgi:hypothetical protein